MMRRVGRPRTWPAFALVLALGVTLGLALSSWADGRAKAGGNPTRTFSSEEEAQLRAGKLVVRPEQRESGDAKLIGGMSWQLIDAPPKRVWKTLVDVSCYPRFLPAVEKVSFIDMVGAQQRLFLSHSYGLVSASYYVLVGTDPKRGVLRFRLDRTRESSLRDAYGELRVSPFGQNKSVVSMAIMADMGSGFVTGFVRGHVHEWMLRVPEQLKLHVEKAVQREKLAPKSAKKPT
jgi:hypothetical protein